MNRHPSSAVNRRSALKSAFTLIELMVVMVIIALLMTLALPRLKGFGQSNAIVAATQQLLDDVALARDTAIASRANVYMVFVPAYGQWVYTNFNPVNLANYSPAELRIVTNLLADQYTAYALYSTRTVGDQPGQSNPRYLTPWRVLPSGTFIATNKFDYNMPYPYVNGVAPFATNAFRFPTATNYSLYGSLMLPYIGFTYEGGLTTNQDAVLPLARGSIFYPRTSGGLLLAPFTPDVEENPPNNSITLSNEVHIDWLTGRAHVERQALQ